MPLLGALTSGKEKVFLREKLSGLLSRPNAKVQSEPRGRQDRRSTGSLSRGSSRGSAASRASSASSAKSLRTTDYDDSEPWAWFWNDAPAATPQCERLSGECNSFGRLRSLSSNGSKMGGTCAYADGQKVEYYSKTNGMWLNAVAGAKYDAHTQKSMYSVIVRGSSQRRRGLGLHVLRTPLASGELCEVFSLKDDWWLLGRVLGWASGVVPSYEVRLSDGIDGGSMVSIVSSALVRRRFPPDSRLLVFRDFERGWVEARAVETLESDFEDAPASWAPEDGPYGDDALEFGGMLEGPTMSTLSQATMVPVGAPKAKGPKRANGTPLDCWFMVPFREVDTETGKEGPRELFPSYLVQPHPESVAKLRAELSATPNFAENLREEEEEEIEKDPRPVPQWLDIEEVDFAAEKATPRRSGGGAGDEGPWAKWLCQSACRCHASAH